MSVLSIIITWNNLLFSNSDMNTVVVDVCCTFFRSHPFSALYRLLYYTLLYFFSSFYLLAFCFFVLQTTVTFTDLY